MSRRYADGLDVFAAQKLIAFCRIIKELATVDFPGASYAAVARAIDLLDPAEEYLVGIRNTLPTTTEVQAIALKLNEAVDIIKKRRNPDENLIQMITDCGPSLKAYLDYIDANHSAKLNWKNDWIVTNTNMCSHGSMLSDMRHLLDGWNIEQHIEYNGHVSFLDS
jgi:hypothetical protein